MNRDNPHIAIVGSGRLAAFMGESLQKAGVRTATLISRNAFTGKLLADRLKADFSQDIQDAASADIIILAVHDYSVAGISAALPAGNFTICHSAGALPLDVLSKHKNRAVIWPLQSISGDLDPMQVPLLFECSEIQASAVLQALLFKAGFSVHEVDTEQRMCYHLSAVFANNFSNAMLAASELVSADKQLDVSLLQALIQHTFENAIKKGALHTQTGPAVRSDLKTMESHLDLLKASPELQKIYSDVSGFIAWMKREKIK